MGWGLGPWGGTAWGGGDDSLLQLISAIAIRENVVRLEFNVAPRLTNTLDLQDAAVPDRYSVVVVTGTIGLDEETVRPVNPLFAQVADVPGAVGRFIDLYVDRSFTHYPAEYRVAVNGLVSYEGAPLDDTLTSYQFFGLRRQFVLAQQDNAIPSRDIANPFTLKAAESSLLSNPEATILGTYAIDASGDYAFDDGLINLKKRIFRRLITNPGSFVSLPNYGVGVLRFLKQLGSAPVRTQLATNAEIQLKQEPDVDDVRADIQSSQPGFYRFNILVKTALRSGAVQFSFAFEAV